MFVKDINWVNVWGKFIKFYLKVIVIYFCLNKCWINDWEWVKEGEEMYCDIL